MGGEEGVAGPAGVGGLAGFAELVAVGHATDAEALTGCTALLFEGGAVAGVDVRGSAAGTRAVEQLRKYHVVERIDGLLLSGGSTFGLSATGGVLRFLEERGRGFATATGPVPIVPTAILYDLGLGSASVRPDEAMGYAAAAAARHALPARGSVGAGTGATVGKLGGMACATKGGVGIGCVAGHGVRVAAVVALNAFGDVVDPGSGRPIAGARTAPDATSMIDSEATICGGAGVRGFGSAAENTTLVAVVTDAALSREQLIVVAGQCHDGLARCVAPVHTPYDGDVAFAASVGEEAAELIVVGLLAKRATIAATLDAVRSATSAGGVPSASELGLEIPEYP